MAKECHKTAKVGGAQALVTCDCEIKNVVSFGLDDDVDRRSRHSMSSTLSHLPELGGYCDKLGEEVI